jgi:hypothetical protein
MNKIISRRLHGGLNKYFREDERSSDTTHVMKGK